MKAAEAEADKKAAEDKEAKAKANALAAEEKLKEEEAAEKKVRMQYTLKHSFTFSYFLSKTNLL